MISRPTRVLLALVALYSAFFGAYYWREGRLSEARLAPARTEFFHDEFIEFSLSSLDPDLDALWRAKAPVVRVFRDGALVRTIAGIEKVALARDPASGHWTGKWPCPWNAPAGRYDLVLEGAEKAITARGPLAGRLKVRPFRIAYRKPKPLPEGFSVMTLESATPFSTMKVRAPDGTVKGWSGLLDWVEYAGADAFWIMAGQTPGLRPGELWASHNFEAIPAIAKECKRRGIKFGVYAMCYLTMSQERLPRYEYARDVDQGETVYTRSISLREPNRVADVISLLKRLGEIEGVEYLGLDYIRNALGGYELVDDFFAEMPGLSKPAGWEKMTLEQRMIHLAQKKIARKDDALIDAWQWWRAHRVAGIVRRIRKELPADKPLWAFTLTWDKGWHHGQDPVMMNDAGIDADALMLYEADEEQFAALLKDWGRYVKRDHVQLVVGNVVDWPLHQRSPEGPKAFSRRLIAAIDRIYSDGPAKGVFVHDIGRALWGRLGPWSTRAWMDEARVAIRHMKARAQARS